MSFYYLYCLEVDRSRNNIGKSFALDLWLMIETTDIFYLLRLYYTKVKLGTASQELTVLIDIGSDVLWVTCSTCSNCSRSSHLRIVFNSFDTGSSFTVSSVSCLDKSCPQSVIKCFSPSQCSYILECGDGSAISGNYLYDQLSLDLVSGNVLTHLSDPVVFRWPNYGIRVIEGKCLCTLSQTGNHVYTIDTAVGVDVGQEEVAELRLSEEACDAAAKKSGHGIGVEDRCQACHLSAAAGVQRLWTIVIVNHAHFLTVFP
ncbi:Xylanase inhibitor, N-terminal [Dillenia turbinata]|uniref:Xylanase inhibitor, N-terminal n=1 Tax=Dillenia turbinata TaxID=194707 RepID=A0AAN8V5D0_9MAGN